MTLTVSLVQTELTWENPGANRTHFDHLLSTVSDTDLVVLPEMFSTGFSMNSSALAEPMTGPTVQWLAQQATACDACICGSMIVAENGNYFNRFLLTQPDGAVYQYDKRHLFRMSTEHENYSPGANRLTIELGDFRLFPQVCYDLRFPVFSRNDLGYDLMIYVANWPAARREHWLALLRARAIENQCYVIGVNRLGIDGNGVTYNGDSVVFDWNGQLILDLGDRETIGRVELDKAALENYREQFPAWKDNDAFQLQDLE